jgi:DNA-binding CsgD family transcriptional regulator
VARRGWQALSPTEAKIAALVADGRSNPDIAAELLLSRSTVQTHVSHILGKLGARSRAEIVRHVLLEETRRTNTAGRRWVGRPWQVEWNGRCLRS